jgi:hypothetical protein
MTNEDFTKEANDLVQEWLGELDTPAPDTLYGDFCQVRVYAAYVAKAEDNWEHYNIYELGKDAAWNQAVAHLEKHGARVVTTADTRQARDWNPVISIVFERYRDTFIGREMNWQSEVWADRFLKVDNPKMVEGHDEPVWYHWKWDMQSRTWQTLTFGDPLRDGRPNPIDVDTENSPLANRWNQLLWAHVEMWADPTFDRDDPDTQNRYNSYVLTDEDGNEVRRVQRYPVIKVAFETREELEAYMHEIGVTEGAADASGFAAIEVTDELVEWLSANDLDEAAWYDASTNSGLAVEMHEMIMTEGTGKLKLKKVSKEFEDAPLSVLEQLADIPAF